MTRINRFPVDQYPPYLSSAVWPTAPYIPATKFVPVPQGVRFVPEYNWGCPEDMHDPDCGCHDGADTLGSLWGSPDKKKARARKKAAKLRAKAAKIEKEAGIFKKAKKAAGLKKTSKSVFKSSTAPAASSEEPSSAEEAAPSMPVPEGVPQNAEEGATNMKLIIGGTLALLAAIGVGFAVQQQKKKSVSRSASAVPAAGSGSLAAPLPAPPPTPAPAAMSDADRVAAELDEMPISANPLPRVMMLAVRPRR